MRKEQVPQVLPVQAEAGEPVGAHQLDDWRLHGHPKLIHCVEKRKDRGRNDGNEHRRGDDFWVTQRVLVSHRVREHGVNGLREHLELEDEAEKEKSHEDEVANTCKEVVRGVGVRIGDGRKEKEQ